MEAARALLLAAAGARGCCRPFTAREAALEAGADPSAAEAALAAVAAEWDAPPRDAPPPAVWRLPLREGEPRRLLWAHARRVVPPAAAPASPAKRPRDEAPATPAMIRPASAKRRCVRPFRSPAASGQAATPGSGRRRSLGMRRRPAPASTPRPARPAPAETPPAPAPASPPAEQEEEEEERKELTLEQEREALEAELEASAAALAKAEASTVLDYEPGETERVAALTRKWTDKCQEVIRALVEALPPGEGGAALTVPELLAAFHIEPEMVRYRPDDEEFY